MRFHGLRHTAATLLMSEGVPIKAVSELLVALRRRDDPADLPARAADDAR